MVQEEGVVAVATATRARARDVGVTFSDRRAPEAPTFEATPVFDLAAFGPSFARYFELRFACGSAPFSGSDEAAFGGWVRHHNPGALDAALAAAYADAWMPAVFARFKAFRPCASVTLTYHFFTDFSSGVEARAGEPVLVTSRSDVLVDGYAEQNNEVWSRSGALLMTGTQVIAVIR